MGIKDFYKVLADECPEQVVKLHLSKLSGCSIAIDISIFLYKYIKSCGETHWMSTFIHLLCVLKKHRIKAICVFDGPNPPPEKLKEQEARRAQLQVITTRLQECIRMRDLLLSEYCPQRKIPDANLKKECRLLISPRQNRKDRTNYDDPGDIAQSLILTIQRLEKQVLPITNKHKELAKDIVRMMGLACFQADGEAETLCAYLACKGDVDAVLTEDTDVLAYGCPIMLAFKDFSIGDNRVHALRYEGIIEELKFTPEEFLDFCILLRCDYNKHEKDSAGNRVKGFPPDGKKRKKPVGIGRKSALCMIQEWRRLEEVSKHIINPELLKFRRCRELFTLPQTIPDMDVPFNKPLNTEALQKLLSENGLSISLDYIQTCCKPVEVVFETDSESEGAEDFEEKADIVNDL